jgi:hypothetical protein
MNTENFTPDAPATAVMEPPPTHLARCASCDYSVRYRPLASFGGFTLADETDLLLGIGPNGRPVCPNGHGEMELADDRLPIDQAINQANEQLDARPQRLPYPSPPFNYADVLHSLCEKRHDIAALEKRVDDRKDALKRAKDELDEANKELGRMIDRFERDERDRLDEIARREAAAAAGHPEETNLVRCAWEQAHQDENCPMCADDKLRPTVRDSSGHVEQVDRLIYLQDTAEIVSLVQDAGIRLSTDTVNAWSVEDRDAVKQWAEEKIGLADTPDLENGPRRPAILGTAHVAADFTTSEAVPGDTYQSCVECGARLLTYKTGDDEGASFEPYPAGTLVGTDCEGAKEPARYAKRGRKAKR